MTAPGPVMRLSTDSRSSATSNTFSGPGSSTLDARSSFALERAELNTRPSLDHFGLGGSAQLWDTGEAAAAEKMVARFPADLQPFIRQLACFPAQSVCPISLFAQVWDVSEAPSHVICERMVVRAPCCGTSGCFDRVCERTCGRLGTHACSNRTNSVFSTLVCTRRVAWKQKTPVLGAFEVG